MATTFVSSTRYLQEAGLVNQAGAYVSNFGKKCLLIADRFVLDLIQTPLAESMTKTEVELIAEEFMGECCRPEIDRLANIARRSGADIIMSAGGGKAVDTGKTVAYETGLTSVVFPTIAATDSPTTAIAVLYESDHTYIGSLKFPNNPDLVLVDTEIIAQAPLRFLVAGMGDAIATKFEARACAQSGAKNVHGHRSTEAGLVLADFTYEVIREHGIGAKLAVERKVVTPALEKVVEANILLSGLGWENGGVAVAHGFHGALTVIQRSHGAYHGEKVAFGVLVQMVMEGRPTEEVRDLLNFYRQIGLPTRLADLGVSNPTDEEMADVAERMCLPGALSHNMPFAIDKKMVKNAIIIADQMGDSLLA